MDRVNGSRDYFNPRSLHGERPRTGFYRPQCSNDFNPRSLHGERLRKMVIHFIQFQISIHAPCTGSDALQIALNRATKHFNPRSLHGERLYQKYG